MIEGTFTPDKGFTGFYREIFYDGSTHINYHVDDSFEYCGYDEHGIIDSGNCTNFDPKDFV